MLNLPYIGHLMWRVNSLEKTLMLGKIEGKRTRGWQRMKWLDSITDSTDMNLRELREIVKDREAMSAVVHEVAKNGTWLGDWTRTQSPGVCLNFASRISWSLLAKVLKSPDPIPGLSWTQCLESRLLVWLPQDSKVMEPMLVLQRLLVSL